MSVQFAIPAAATPAANGHCEAHSTATFRALMLGSIGVVYGDIGTSPLYALREAVVAASGSSAAASPQAVLGVLSLILWALIVVVTLKYVVILLRADNNGEGGTLALMALAQRAVGKGGAAIVLLGIISGALFYGDAVITPALSVLSAIEGIKLVTVTFEHYVVPLTVIILVALFAVQSRGTARVAALFGPVMCVWFAVIAVAAVPQIMRHPEVLLALNPLYAISFMLHHGMIGFITLGAVFLAVTGAEALYADLGHFGKRPIQTAWLIMVLPSLAVNYLGQGALLIADGGAGDSGHRDREPGRHHRRLFADAYGDPARPAAAVRNSSYLGSPFRPDLHSAYQHAAVAGGDPAGGAVPFVERAGLGLRNLGHRDHGGHGHDGLCRDLAGLEMVAVRGRRPDRPVPVPRHHLPCRQSAEGVRRRLGAAGAGRHRDAADVHMAPRQSAAV
jgi:hypothetical protein